MATKAKFYIATSNGWVEADFGGSGNGSFYGVCNTAAGTSAKTVTGVEDFPTTLESGCSINIKFQYANTTTVNLTLNINNTGAKTIYRNGTSADATWSSGAIINFVYDGTNWVMTDASSRNTDTNYYHTTGQWNGLTYTATAHGGVGDLKFTLPTGTNSTTVSRGDHGHTKLTGVYTSNGGAQPPSYAGTFSLKCNMMNKFVGTSTSFSSYADVLLMNAYSWSDVPYATALAIQKTNGIPRAWIAAGGNTDSWSGATEIITANNIGSQSVASANSVTNQLKIYLGPKSDNIIRTYNGSSETEVVISPNSIGALPSDYIPSKLKHHDFMSETYWQLEPNGNNLVYKMYDQGVGDGSVVFDITGHNHDSRYYTETEVNNLLNNKSDATHDHDDTYIKQTTEATATTIGGVCIKLSNGILYISTTPMTS